jgi:hypothetical protein
VAPDAGTTEQPAPPPTPAAKLDGQSPQLNFDFFGEAPKPGLVLTPAETQREDVVGEAAKKRRHRLEVHQLLGMTTWGFMLAASVVGQLNYNDLYGGGSGKGTWLMPHRVLVYSTAILYGTTAGYALFAPKPYAKPLKLDTGLLHRVAAIGASAGMVAQMVLGFITARTADAGNGSDLKRNAKIHDVLGWTTFGFMTVAGTAWIF